MNMRGIEVPEFGGPSALTYREDLPIPSIGDNEILIKNHYAGVNFKDIILCQGNYHGGNPDLPFIPGIEASGIIAAIGKEVDNFKVGQRVAYMTGSMASKHNSCYAEYNFVPADGFIQTLPENLPYEAACRAAPPPGSSPWLRIAPQH